MTTTRREFLARTTTLLATGAALPAFLGRSALALSGSTPRDESVLVVLQLSGGNDGLNTVIPHGDDAYHRARPTLAVPSSRVHALDDRLGLHPEMTGLKDLFDQGRLAVIENVGYPNPDRSHFASMDIWHTGSTRAEGVREGWLGRYAGETGTPRTPPGAPVALHLDNASLPLALQAREHHVPSIRDLASFRLRAPADELVALLSEERQAPSGEVAFVQRLAVESCRNARRLERVTAGDGNDRGYPDHPLGSRLRQIARLIGAGFGPRVYYTSLGGFDTHSRQELVHPQLLRVLSDAVAAFFRDLDRLGWSERTVLLTFSEFGRRVQENGSLGTDHGAAAPMFLAGPRCVAGVHGGYPDLENLDNGDVRHRVDFRRVYATVLRDVLGADPDKVLGERYETLGLVQRRVGATGGAGAADSSSTPNREA